MDNFRLVLLPLLKSTPSSPSTLNPYSQRDLAIAKSTVNEPVRGDPSLHRHWLPTPAHLQPPPQPRAPPPPSAPATEPSDPLASWHFWRQLFLGIVLPLDRCESRSWHSCFRLVWTRAPASLLEITTWPDNKWGQQASLLLLLPDDDSAPHFSFSLLLFFNALMCSQKKEAQSWHLIHSENLKILWSCLWMSMLNVAIVGQRRTWGPSVTGGSSVWLVLALCQNLNIILGKSFLQKQSFLISQLRKITNISLWAEMHVAESTLI